MRRCENRTCVTALGIVWLVGIALAVGCSYSGYVTSGLGIADKAAGGPVSGGESASPSMPKHYIDVSLGGDSGSRDKNTGDIVMSSTVDPKPTFQYSVRDPDAFGTITSVILNIHLMHPDRKDQPFDASYVIALASADNSKLAFKPDIAYDLGQPIPGVKVIYPATYKGEKDGSINLPADSHFCMTVTVQASRAETARVMFQTP
jgi:hypothetical protein